MHILIVDGWTNDGNAQHLNAGCITQADVFKSLVNSNLPNAKTTIVNTDLNHPLPEMDLDRFNATIWTGGGGNIYDHNQFNANQLALCEKALTSIPFFWGSCWGLQVAVTVLGGQVSQANQPEIGIAYNIKLTEAGISNSLYNNKPHIFDGPAHHGDEVTRLPSDLIVLAENDVTIQAVGSNTNNLICTQYHPEVSYNYLRKLLEYWAPNYKTMFSHEAFDTLLATLSEKEKREADMRQVELINWLDFAHKAS